MDSATVTAEYIAGITEGRQLLKLMREQGQDVQASIPSILANLKAANRGASAPVRELYRGEADFWRGQADHALQVYKDRKLTP